MLAAALVAAGLSGCGRSEDPQLIDLRNSGNGPDEFGIVPNKPLEIPQDLASLPTPVPGGENRARATPMADAMVALGGDPDRARSGDAGLMRHVTRFGVAPNIRADLALEDLEFRRRNAGRPLERLFGVTVYFDAYAEQSLDKYAELQRARRAGIATPTAPPPPGDDE